jgi:hypothetical protein
MFFIVAAGKVDGSEVSVVIAGFQASLLTLLFFHEIRNKGIIKERRNVRDGSV